MDGFASKPIEPLRLIGEIARVVGLHGLADDLVTTTCLATRAPCP